MKLTEEDYERAAAQIDCNVPAIKAVAFVEAGKYGAFLESGEPTILFERHVFHRLTGGKYDTTHPNISNKKPGGYGTVESQHARLQEAAQLDREAALKSASWGLFQVMGFNWESLGYASLQQFINAMYRSEADHLDAFVRYIKVNNLAKWLRLKRWARFAAGYNGLEYWRNAYHLKIAAAYRAFGGR